MDILLLQQREDDTCFGRFSKQWNILTETREADERVRDTVRRSLQEELGCSYLLFSVQEGSYRETNEWYEKQMGYSYTFRCCVLLYKGNPFVDPKEVFQSQDDEIIGYKWVGIRELDTYDIEYGARLVIDYYLQSL